MPLWMKVLSPMVPRGETDYLLVLALSEIEVTRPLLRPTGVLIRPDLVKESELTNRRSLNVALLGALSYHLAAVIPENTFLEAVKASLPERLHTMNEQAFALGRATAAREKGGVR